MNAPASPAGSLAPGSGRSSYVRRGEGPHWERTAAPDGERVMRFGDAMFFLRHDDCMAILRDPRFPQWNFAQVERNPAIDRRFVERRRQAFLSMEGPDHQRLRRLAMVALSPQVADRHRPRMRAIMDALIDAVLPAGRMEAVGEVLERYPMPVICGILGVPQEDIPFFAQTALDWTRWMYGGPPAVPAALAAHEAMDAYMARLVEGRANHEGDDVISGLLRAESEGDRLTRDEVIHTAAALIVPGLETTFSSLGSGLYLFAQHPEQWEMLAADPSLLPGAAEEILRFAPVAPTLERIATVDAEINGVPVPRDTQVVLALAAVNRDPALFPEPDRFDITRRPQRLHMSFGGGRHTCLGLHIARAELQEALGCLSRRLTALELDGEPTWSIPLGFQGPRRMPMRFRARG
jgi:cytochrome P450